MDVVWRSFRVSWRHKYLWLIALFSGEGGGGGGGGGGPSGQLGSRSPGGRLPDVQGALNQVGAWITDHTGLIVLIAVVWLLVVIAFFILAAVCEGATIRASAEHDAERPWRLALAWRAGVHTVWPMVRFRLLLIALAIPVVVVYSALAVLLVIGLAGKNSGAIAAAVSAALLLILPAFLYGLYLFFLDRLGSRALVLDQLGAVASIVRGHRLLRKRLGRSLLVWLLSIAVGIVAGIVLLSVFGIVLVPVVVIAAALYTSHSAAFWPVVSLAVVVLFPVLLLVSAFLAAQGSTYWTVAFRRIDLDYQPR